MIQPNAKGARKHIVTITIEDYFQVGTFSQLIPFSHWERFDARIKRNTDATLELLDQSGTRATFFASGWIGDNYPEILRSVVEAGHEVACQGYYQQSIRDIAPRAFQEDLRRSRRAIEDATGQGVQGFRVGRGRISADDVWALDILAEENFSYDASIAPIGRQFSHQPERFILHQHSAPCGELWEVPASATSLFGWAIPFSGGNYIRQLPAWLIREAVARWVERRHAPLVMYFHIWELDTDQPVINAASWIQRVRHYRNLAGMPERIRYFLERYAFTSINRYLDLGEIPIERGAPVDPALPVTLMSEDTAGQVGDKQTELSIVIPCYNEEASLSYLNKTLDNFCVASAGSLRPNFIFVDDGSRDTTWNKLNAYFATRPDCRLVRHERNKGIAAAIITGFKNSTSDIVAVLDADCTFNPVQLIDMVPLLRDGVAAVAASPLHFQGSLANVPSWRLMLSKGAALLYRSVLHHKFTSYTSCFRVYRRSAVAELSVINQGFCGVAEILARLDLAGYRIVECPAELETRLLGQSKINLLKTIIDHLRLIARLAAARWLKIPLPNSASD
jgi:polysaccharide deacetylase family protein (PEP-CTERM system associated)